MYVRHAGFVVGAELFDAGFFGISAAEAKTMDPQQRLVLEVCYQALNRGGMTKEALMGSDASLCVGQCNNDWGHMGFAVSENEKMNPYTGLAVSTSISSNRVSYVLGMKGPSATIDTACSSSLVAADVVLANLKRGRSSTGIAMGVNLNLMPGPFIACSKAHMLSEDGRCKTFNATADGYVRGEGCGGAVLKLMDSLGSDTAVQIVLNGSAANQDGRSSSQTAPHGPSQQDVILTALQEAELAPHTITCMEAHGTGTALGDPIEVGALKNTYGEGRTEDLVLCAAKSNIGHLEGAAGIAGLVKVAAMLPRQLAPPNLHFKELNPHIDAEDFPMTVPAESLIELGEDFLSSGLSSFGFGGTNAHIVLSEPPQVKLPDPAKDVVYERQNFSWQQVRHPLLARRENIPDGPQIFAAPFAGRLLQLVSHHIIFGEIVVPGATYLEMILAAGEYHLGAKGTMWSITNVGFQSPLVLKVDGTGALLKDTELYLQLYPDKHWAMSSFHTAEGKIAAVHAEGNVEMNGEASTKPKVDLDALRASCNEDVMIERLYLPFSKIGLPLQPRFRTSRKLLRNDKEILALVAAENDATNAGFLFNPAVIDGTFQASMTFLLAHNSTELDNMTSLRIPLLVQRVTNYAQGYKTSVWVHHTMTDINEKELGVRSSLCQEDGRVMLGMDGLRFREVRPEHIQKMLQQATDNIEEDILETDWMPLEPLAGNDLLSGSVCFVGASAPLQKELAAKCPSASFTEDVTDMQPSAFDLVVHVASMKFPADDESELEVLHSALQLVQKVAEEANSNPDNLPTVWLVTRGTQAPGQGGGYYHAGLWGMARTVILEAQDVKLRCLDLDSSQEAPASIAATLARFLGELGKSPAETEIALRFAEGSEIPQVWAPRLTRSVVLPKKAIRLQMSSRGSLANLRPVPQDNRRAPSHGEVEVRVRATGLNFRDVLNVMGMYPGDPGNPGGDCAGTVTAVGADPAGLSPGDDVFGIVFGCLQTYATGNALLLVPKPEQWGFEQMAAWSVTFATVEEAFQELAPLVSGERVLIHAATGGVGLVAVQFAQRVGATIFATAGSPAKVEFLQNMGVKYITTSRDGAAFEADMKRFLEEDGADGIDCVLNSLSHGDYIPRSLALLKQGGRFMEIGKRDIWTHAQMRSTRPDVQYEKIAMDWVMEFQPERYNQLMRRLVTQINKGWWKPLPTKSFETLEAGIDALRFLQRAQQIGKVVLTQPSRMNCRPDATYLLSGGTGALGLVTTLMLAEEGAKSTVLLSRSGKVPADLQETWEHLQTFAVNLQVKPCDVSRMDDVMQLTGMLPVDKPVGGVIHLAAVLNDATLPKLTRSHLDKAYGAKVHGARHLHTAFASTMNPLDFMVLFSSTSALLGSPGQANYSAANAALDAHARVWQEQGEKAWSVMWGPWREAGMATAGTVERLKAQGLGSLPNTVGMAALTASLGADNGVIAACPVRWGVYLKKFGSSVPPFLSRFKKEMGVQAAGPAAEQKSAGVAVTAEDLARLVMTTALEVSGSATVGADEPLMDAGMDSLAAVEFRNRLANELPMVKLPNTLIFDYPTVSSISEFAASQIAPVEATPAVLAAGATSGASLMEAPVQVGGLASYFPGGRNHEYWSNLNQGRDSVIEIPYTRWDLATYFDADADVPGKIYCKHGGFIDGAEMFDAGLFGLSGAEVKTIDPQQRLLLELAQLSFSAAGLEKASLMGADVGVFIGQCQYDWFVLTSSGQSFNPYTGTGISASISANRISYIFGLKGPSVTSDTACSSSLVAADAALSNVRRRVINSSVIGGTNLILGVAPYIGFCKAKMLDVEGRCKTFNATADGYTRGEGAGTVYISSGELGGRVGAVLRSTAANQDGRSASLTAPNGPSQVKVLLRACLEAGIAPGAISVVESHGTGTGLGDPIEVDALRNTHGKDRGQPLCLGAAKSGLAHLEGSAGMAGFEKAIAMVARRWIPPNLHCNELNSHIDLEDFDALVQSESTKLRGDVISSGLSSFGFGGTNTHLVVAEDSSRVVAPVAQVVEFKRQPFSWTGPIYRLLRHKIQEGGNTVFEAPIKSDVFSVVSEHVVFGEIVTPGVVYVESAMEATRANIGNEAYLKDVNMVWPLVIPKNADEPNGPTVYLRYVQMGSDKFEIQSRREGVDPMTHCEGRIGRSAGEAAVMPLEDLRAQCTESVDPADVYGAIHKGGLWLGPKFRVCKTMVRSGFRGEGDVLCHLEHSPDIVNNGYFMHPAMLDGTIHVLGATLLGWDAPLKVFAGVAKMSVKQKRDFSRDSSYWCHLHLTEFGEQAQVFTSTVGSESGDVLFVGDDVVFRKVTPDQIQKAMQSQAAEDDQKLFTTEWAQSKMKMSESGSTGDWLFVSDSEEMLKSLEKSTFKSCTSSRLTELVNESGEAYLSGFTKVISTVGLNSKASGNASAVDVLDHALQLMQAVSRIKDSVPELWFITCAAVQRQAGDLKSADLPLHAGLWGLARGCRAELSDLKICCLDLEKQTSGASAVIEQVTRALECQGGTFEPEIAIREGSLYVPRLEDSTATISAVDPVTFDSNASYVISGGTGSLGSVFAQWMAGKGAKHFALLSRSGKPPSDKISLAAFNSVTSMATIKRCNIGSADDVKRMMGELATSLPPVKGIMHAAGALDDHLINDLNRSHLEVVLAPKVAGTVNLHNASADLSLDVFAMFSSLAAMVGNAGQANYCAGNFFLDSFTGYRRDNDRPAVSVQWGPWGGVGMAVEKGTSEKTFPKLELQSGLQAMETILSASASLNSGVVGVARIIWKSYLGQLPAVPPYMDNFKQFRASDKKKAGAGGAALSKEFVVTGIENVLKEVLGDDSLEDFSMPLMDMGLDSLAAVEFRNRVQSSFDGVRLSSTVMFDYPTVAYLTEFILSQFAPEEEDGGGAALGDAAGGLKDPMAMIGISGRYPGMRHTNDISEFWTALCSGNDPVTEVPLERFDINALYDEDRAAPGKVYVRNGAFIPGIEEFDMQFFGIGDVEARGMDTHQRLLLEVAFDSFHGGGFSKETLAGVTCGVFIGCCTLTGITVDPEDIGPFTNIGAGQSGLSGRVSHALGLRGPCFTIDTACSSTLVALDSAMQASRLAKQEMACVGGVNLQLRTDMWVGFCKMTGLAANGRCKTFDASADGFARGEGVGSCILRMLGTATEKNDTVVAVFRGTCVNQDGRSATITAPSGPAQERCIKAALKDGDLTGLDVNLIECHGTGTALGDPIEVGAQGKVYGKGRADEDKVILAAVKSCITHLEGAAGIAGLTKLTKMLEHHQVPQNLHLKQLNPNIDLSDFEVIMPSSVIEWKCFSDTRRAGISSFGFSGTNSHGIAEQPPASTGATEARQVAPLIWSRQDLSYRDWATGMFSVVQWKPKALVAGKSLPTGPCLIIGDSLAKSIQQRVPGSEVVAASNQAALVKVLQQKQWDMLVYAEPLSSKTEQETLNTLLAVLREAVSWKRNVKLMTLTCGAQTAVPDGNMQRGVMGAAIWGLLRSVFMEAPMLQLQTLDFEAAEDASPIADLVADELTTTGDAADSEVAYANGERCVPRLVPSVVPMAAGSAVSPDATYLVTGGLGGLGLLMAQSLLEMGAKSLVLVSRSGKTPAGDQVLAQMFEDLKSSSASVHAWKCDVGNATQVRDTIARIRTELPDAPLRGVLHAAGILDYCKLEELDGARMASTFGPKCQGAWNLHQETLSEKLDMFVQFSSISALIGLSSAASYSTSNSYLDGLVRWRKACGLPATSIQWGAVSDVGMSAQADHNVPPDYFLQLVTPKQAQSAFRRLVSASASPCVLFARVDFTKFLQDTGVKMPMLADYEVKSGGMGALANDFAGLSQTELQSTISSRVVQVANTVLGIELEQDAPLMESGLDSLSAVDFRNQVSKQLPGVKMPSTLMFDYPTVAGIASYAASQLAPTLGTAAKVGSATIVTAPAESYDPLALLSTACHFPAGGESPDLFWAALMSKTDGVTRIPHDRWDNDEYYAANGGPGKLYVQHASFIKGVELFDAGLFNISGAEAASMDPQQRLLLEVVQQGFHRAKRDQQSLMGADVGTFVGECNNDWGHFKNLEFAKMNPFSGTGGSMSISANRLAYVFGIKGPSVTSDTACSSSLVALDQAATALWRSRCSTAVSAGVNLNLIPGPFIACCQARMLAGDGRCKTFDEAADGYSRGEGCGAAILQRQASTSTAAALPWVKGTGVNQDGRSSSLTAPNGPAQQDVITMAWEEAQIEPSSADYVETHGTGTGLGDPIEIGALSATMGPNRTTEAVLGAVKTNVSHLEGAAGIAGLLKGIAACMQSQVPPNLHFKSLNPHIDLDDFMALIPGESVVVRSAETLRNFGLSSFGFGGTNTHVVSASPQEMAKSEDIVEVTPLVFNRQKFSWTEVKHPLLVTGTPGPQPNITVFSAPIRGKLVKLLSHHIIYGEIVVPGATYIEMVIATASYRLGKANSKFSLTNLGFQSPLVLRADGDELEVPKDLTLHLYDNGRWAMNSSEQGKIVATHAEGSLSLSEGPAEKRELHRDEICSRLADEVPQMCMYEPFANIGLPLQPRFRSVRKINRTRAGAALPGDEIIANVAAEEDGTNAGMLFGPAVIDGLFQASCAFNDLNNLPALKIPLSIDRITLYGQGFSPDVWVHHKMIENTDKMLSSDMVVSRADETVILSMDRMRLREVRPEHIAKMLASAAGKADEDMLEVQWIPLDIKEHKPADLGEVLVVGADATLQVALKTQFPSVAFANVGAVQEHSSDNVVFLGAISDATPEGELDVLNDALSLSQSAMQKKPKNMWWVTRGTQAVGASAGYINAGLWGMARTFRLEERAVRLRCLDLDASTQGAENTAVAIKTWLASLSSTALEAENEVAVRPASEGSGEQAFSTRLARSSTESKRTMCLQMSSRGSLSNLRPITQETRRDPKATEAEIRVRAVGLNFRDVLNVMGLYPGDPGQPGADASGTVTAVGKDVDHIRPGDDVFGESPGCLGAYNTGSAPLLTLKPKSWSYEAASCMPVIFATVEEALGDLAKLSRGESVLIHAAAGGVGLVAIQYAQYVGAKVYATAGSEEKHAYLRGLGVSRITTTRKGQKFEDDMKEFLKEDGLDGIDVVINSLSHDDYIPRSLALLKKGGRFMEIGKRDIWSHEAMREARPDVMYEKIASDTMMEKEPWRYNGYMKRLLERVDQGGLVPINMHLFEHMEHGVKAFQFLQRAQNIGKVVISSPSRIGCRPDVDYVLTGGMGAIGMVTARFLVEEGAKSISLLSRSGKAAADVQDLWAWLQTSSVSVTSQTCDVVSKDDVQRTVSEMAKKGAVGGVIHLAAVLDDAAIPKLTRSHLEKSYGAKVFGARNIQAAYAKAKDPLDFLILFSSSSTLFGNIGQANYTAANAALDAHAWCWQQQGEKAWSVQWGPWKEVGMASHGAADRMKSNGIYSLSNAAGMAALAGVLSASAATIIAQPMLWSKYLKQYPKVPVFLANFAAEAKAEPKAAVAAPRGMQVAAAPVAPALSVASIKGLLHKIATEVTGSDGVENDSSLMDSGMDSLAAVEFRNRLAAELPQVDLPNTLIFDYPSLASIAGFAGSQLQSSATATHTMVAMPGAHMAPRVTLESALDLLKRTAQETMGGDVDADNPLMDSGMDSLAAVEFRNRLANEMPAVELPNTLIFDYPTITDVAGFMVSQLGAVEQVMPQIGGPIGVATDEALAIVGASCNFPGDSWNLRVYARHLAEGADGIVEVPFTRWELDDVHDSNPDAPGKMYPRHGAFIEGAELFDAGCFGIQAPEARAMDPQQRLILESSLNALVDSGYRKSDLMGKNVAVFVGQANNDWIQMQSWDLTKVSPYTATGMSASISAARVSYALGIKGASYIVDTACSSALVALDSAAVAVRRGRASASVNSACNVMASPSTYVSFSKPRMLSATGRCLTFDASADGYARGEGAGTAVLKSLSMAGGRAGATLLGVAVNQDGRSTTLTAPNGPSQQDVMGIALGEAQRTAMEVTHMECHGTGTPLGDPIELGALQAMNKGRGHDLPLVVAAVKSNVGHLEGAAGSTGLLKSIAVMSQRVSFASLHLSHLNPHIDALRSLPAGFVSEFQPLGVGSNFGGLSSFGFGGTNVHTVFGEASNPAKLGSQLYPFTRKAYTWRETGYRFLRSKPEPGSFEVAMRADIYDIVKHHVVFGYRYTWRRLRGDGT
jgi:acyl transferase domain-containing protein/NADPH:quinone reductase-like Zn-dependent oxidoreductase/acyl carrier protein